MNRWLIVGAVAATGLISVAAANAFHGHTRGASSTATTSRVSTKGKRTNAGAATTSLQPPAQALVPASPSGGGGVVSGGS